MGNRLQFRRDTAANWTSVNPILRQGEPGIVLAGGVPSAMKIGDGATAWEDLPNFGGGGGTTVSNIAWVDNVAYLVNTPSEHTYKDLDVALNTEALGTYFFVKDNGVGTAYSITSAVSNKLLLGQVTGGIGVLYLSFGAGCTGFSIVTNFLGLVATQASVDITQFSVRGYDTYLSITIPDIASAMAITLTGKFANVDIHTDSTSFIATDIKIGDNGANCAIEKLTIDKGALALGFRSCQIEAYNNGYCFIGTGNVYADLFVIKTDTTGKFDISLNQIHSGNIDLQPAVAMQYSLQSRLIVGIFEVVQFQNSSWTGYSAEQKRAFISLCRLVSCEVNIGGLALTADSGVQTNLSASSFVYARPTPTAAYMLYFGSKVLISEVYMLSGGGAYTFTSANFPGCSDAFKFLESTEGGGNVAAWKECEFVLKNSFDSLLIAAPYCDLFKNTDTYIYGISFDNTLLDVSNWRIDFVDTGVSEKSIFKRSVDGVSVLVSCKVRGKALVTSSVAGDVKLKLIGSTQVAAGTNDLRFDASVSGNTGNRIIDVAGAMADELTVTVQKSGTCTVDVEIASVAAWYSKFVVGATGVRNLKVGDLWYATLELVGQVTDIMLGYTSGLDNMAPDNSVISNLACTGTVAVSQNASDNTINNTRADTAITVASGCNGNIFNGGSTAAVTHAGNACMYSGVGMSSLNISGNNNGINGVVAAAVTNTGTGNYYSTLIPIP